MEEEREWGFLYAYVANTMQFVFHVFYDPLVIAVSPVSTVNTCLGAETYKIYTENSGFKFPR